MLSNTGSTETVVKYVVYRLPALGAILFNWIMMKVAQQLTGLTWAGPVVWPISPVSCWTRQIRWILIKQVWKQTSGDPSGQTWNYRGIMFSYNFTTALLYMVLSVTMARIVAMLLNIYQTVKITNKYII